MQGISVATRREISPAKDPGRPGRIVWVELNCPVGHLGTITLERWRRKHKGPPFIRLSGARVAYPIDRLRNWMASGEADSMKHIDAAQKARIIVSVRAAAVATATMWNELNLIEDAMDGMWDELGLADTTTQKFVTWWMRSPRN